MTHTADGTMFTGLGIDAYRLMLISSAFKLEAVGLKAPGMHGKSVNGVIKRDYGLKAARTPEKKREMAEVFKGLSQRLGYAINMNETEHLIALQGFKDAGQYAEFLQYLVGMCKG